MNRVSLVFCTYDRASESYSPPFAAPHAGVAIRSFTDAVTNPAMDTDISKHADDFDLFEIGTFDSSTGIITPREGGNLLLVQGKQVSIRRSLDPRQTELLDS